MTKKTSKKVTKKVQKVTKAVHKVTVKKGIINLNFSL